MTALRVAEESYEARFAEAVDGLAARLTLVPRYTVDAQGRLVDRDKACQWVPVCPVCEGEITDSEQGCVPCRSDRQRWFSS